MPTDSADDPDVGGPDDTLSPAESLDSDDVRNADGDVVVEPPEEWIEPELDESLDERLASEEPDTSVDTPQSDAASTPEGVSAPEFGVNKADVVDGTPEDGDSFFDVK